MVRDPSVRPTPVPKPPELHAAKEKEQNAERAVDAVTKRIVDSTGSTDCSARKKAAKAVNRVKL